MKGGRKNLKRAAMEQKATLHDDQSIAQVVSLRGSNLIEVMDARGEKTIALFPAKFQKSMWIKRGSFVVVDESGKEKALESGSKVASIVSQVLFREQLRELQKSPEWPKIFKPTEDGDSELPKETAKQEKESDCSDDDDLPPLEANTNRVNPFQFQGNADSDSNSDTDS